MQRNRLKEECLLVAANTHNLEYVATPMQGMHGRYIRVNGRDVAFSQVLAQKVVKQSKQSLVFFSPSNEQVLNMLDIPFVPLLRHRPCQVAWSKLSL